VGEERPDFRTISDFRKRHLAAFCDVLVQGLRIAGEAGWVKLGNVAPEGTTLQGHASRPKAMSYGYRQPEGERLREESETWVTPASQQDAEDEAALGSRRGAELPAALARRADRWAPSEAAMPRVEARANAEAEAERQRRAEAEAERQRPGKKRRGRAPKAVDEMPDDKAQMRFPAPELGIMQTHNKGWDSWGNAQARVDGAYQIIVACDVPAEANDQQQAAPMAQGTVTPWAQAGIAIPTDATGATQKMPATYDSGSESEAAAAAGEQWGCEPYRATGRQRHPGLEPQVTETPTTAKERMAVQVRTPEGRAVDARRKVIVEPGFGPSKAARGFRRFLWRGLAKIRGEWRRVCLTHHLLKIGRYGWGPRAASHAERSREGHATAPRARSCPL
jgi:hypothetical protein